MMSNTIQTLNGIKELLQAKYPNADVRKPSYYQEGDMYSTAHYYSLTSKMENGNVLTLGITVNYIPYGGADYEFTISIEKNNEMIRHRRIEISKNQISIQGIKDLLSGKFKIQL